MFTGIIEEIGLIERSIPSGRGRELQIRAGIVLDGLKPDDSLAVNGVCLTVKKVIQNGFEADAVEETLKKTTMDSWISGKRVNLERAMPANGRFGGHVVQGHVDGTGNVMSIRTSGQSKLLEIEVIPEFSRYIVPKGSIAIDGVSLTIAVLNGGRFQLSLIPHTLERTTLSLLKPGDKVNVEMDVLGKYVEKMMLSYDNEIRKLNIERMKNLGY